MAPLFTLLFAVVEQQVEESVAKDVLRSVVTEGTLNDNFERRTVLLSVVVFGQIKECQCIHERFHSLFTQ